LARENWRSGSALPQPGSPCAGKRGLAAFRQPDLREKIVMNGRLTELMNFSQIF